MSDRPISELDHVAGRPVQEPVELATEPRKTGVRVPILLLILSLATTLYSGFLFDVSFVMNDAENLAKPTSLLEEPTQILRGAPFSLTLLLILLAHELGHYLTCRRYKIQATLPHLIPAPPLLPIPPPLSWLLGAGLLGWAALPFNPFGTFGAVIRIRSAFRDRTQLFDVGIAGPLAGFVFVVPAMIWGIVCSKDFVFTDTSGVALEFGEPLIFQLAADLLYTAGDGSSINLHPVGMAAWFGMLATSLNLLPIGQLDGGHIVYALFGPKIHRYVSYLAFLGLISISLLSWPSLSYLVFAFVLIIMGFRHPRPYQEHVGVKGWRWVIAAIGLLIFILTFIPVPIQLIEHTVTL